MSSLSTGRGRPDTASGDAGALSRLIGVGGEEFGERYWYRAALHSPRVGDYADLFGTAAVDELIAIFLQFVKFPARVTFSASSDSGMHSMQASSLLAHWRIYDSHMCVTSVM